MGNTDSQCLDEGLKIHNDINVEWTSTNHTRPTTFVGLEGHCSASAKESVFVFGGVDANAEESNSLWQLKSDEWSKVAVKGCVPAPRTAACLQAVDNQLYLFGGMSADQGWLNDLHVFDVHEQRWSAVTGEGTVPSPRDKCACAVIDKQIFFFGGFGPEGMPDDDDVDDSEEEDDPSAVQFGWFNDLHILDTAGDGRPKWHQVVQLNSCRPTPRAATSMCAVDSILYIFGGRDRESRRNDLHAFDTETKKWLQDLSVQGTCPAPRSFHTMSNVGHRLVVFGGRGEKNQHFNDLHIFDTRTKEWLQPTVKGTPPSARGNHTACVVSDQLVIFAGSSEFHSELNHCQKIHDDRFSLKAVPNIISDETKKATVTSPETGCNPDDSGESPAKKTKTN